MPGSSPRMRGTQQPCHTRPVRTGLIPTYAGNTCPTLEPPGCLRAHPHVCGEHTTLMEVSRAPKGSSPRMRGTHNRITPAHHTAGLIPTYAGNTSHAEGGDEAFRAHPHVCGEHGGRLLAEIVDAGSSPRMRGTRFFTSSSAIRNGLIPTYAGNTWTYQPA